MSQYYNRTIFILLLLIFVWPFCRANAYVLPGPYLLELVTQKFKRPGRLLVIQKLFLYGEVSDEIVEFNETLRYIFPQSFRSDIISNQVQRILVVSRGTALTIIGGKTTSASETRYDFYKDILLYSYRSVLEERLILRGVDVNISSLGRFQGKPAFVLGAIYPDDSVPQVWIDKQTFLPFRWLVTGEAKSGSEDTLEIRYLNWRKFDRTWYPMQIEFYKNDILIREIKVATVQINPTFTKDLFDINRLKSTYTHYDNNKTEQNKAEQLDEIQKTIEEFKKIYE